MMAPLVEKIELINNNDELIDIFDFIFNFLSLMMKVKVEKRKYDIFLNIIEMCFLFEFKKAKSYLSKKTKKNYPMYILVIHQ